jgi:molybdopterin biosynthesis enzyme
VFTISLKAALKELGAEIFFERVSLCGRANPPSSRGWGDADIWPAGNPGSVAVTFNLFARASLWAMQGATQPGLGHEHAVLAHDIKGSVDRESYLPAILRTDEKEFCWQSL